MYVYVFMQPWSNNSTVSTSRTLVAGGAYDFAVSMKLPAVDHKELISPRAQQDWAYWKERINENVANHQMGSLLHDTVGAVAFDCNDNVAAGVSR